MTEISESRSRELLQWLDDQAGDHTHLFEQMTRYRDAAALIRQLDAAEQSAWHAGLDAGREQGRGKDHAYQPPSAPVGVEWPLSLLRAGHWREVYVGHRCMRLEVTYEHATWERLMAEVGSALAQQSAVHPRSTHRVWRGDDWQPCYCEATDDHRIGSEQPAAVDEADRDDARRYRALVATGKYVPSMREGWGLACGRSKASKAELDAAVDALAQQGGSDNDH